MNDDVQVIKRWICEDGFKEEYFTYNVEESMGGK